MRVRYNDSWSVTGGEDLPPVWKDRRGKLYVWEFDNRGELVLAGENMVKFDALAKLPRSYDKLFVWDASLEGVEPVLLSLNPAFFAAWREWPKN